MYIVHKITLGLIRLDVPPPMSTSMSVPPTMSTSMSVPTPLHRPDAHPFTGIAAADHSAAEDDVVILVQWDQASLIDQQYEGQIDFYSQQQRIEEKNQQYRLQNPYRDDSPSSHQQIHTLPRDADIVSMPFPGSNDGGFSPFMHGLPSIDHISEGFYPEWFCQIPGTLYN